MTVTAIPRGWVVASSLGVTHGRQIGLANTGPRQAVTGTTYNTRQTISSNNVTVSNNIYNYGLTITGSGVTVEDCIIRDNDNSSFANLRINGANATIRYCEIDNEDLVYYQCHVAADSTEANPTRIYRNYIHNGGHGVNGEDSVWWEFYENYVADISAPDPAPYPGDDVWHADGIIAWGANITIARNKILVPIPQTGVINIGVWSGSVMHVDNVTIDSNYFAGAGYIFYVEEKDNVTYNVTNMSITDNDIGRDYYTNGGFYGIWYQNFPPDTNPTVTGNRLVESNGTFVSNVSYYQ